MVLQQLDYLEFLDIYHDRVRAFHVKDAEFRPTGAPASMAAIRTGSTGQADSARWATARWISNPSSAKWRSTTSPAGLCWSGSAASSIPKAGATEGAIFIGNHIIHVTDRAFDDFAGSGANVEKNRRILGLEQEAAPAP